jgi:anaerobic selenocysteine-containing dehydrogenase
VFASASPSTSAISDSVDWITRLRPAFGSPNFCYSMELCGWGRYLASTYTFGSAVPGGFMPDLERAGCILYWGYNPSVARLVHATATVDARRRGAKLVAIDPRRAGRASSADHWLRVRPGTDAALALAITGVPLDRGLYDIEFVRRFTNAPLLVRADTGRLLRSDDVPRAEPGRYVAWDTTVAAPVSYDAAIRSHDGDEAHLALDGRYTIGGIHCRPVLAELAEHCRECGPEAAAAICGVPAAEIERVAETLWTSRPVRSIRGAGSSSTAGRPRRSARSTCSTLCWAASTRRAATSCSPRCRPTRSTGSGCSRPSSVRRRSGSTTGRSGRRGTAGRSRH